MNMHIQAQKRNIVEVNLNKYFMHLYIYNAVSWLHRHFGWLIKAIWLIAVAIGIVITFFDMDHPLLMWAISIWFMAWVAMFILAGIDRVVMNITIERAFKASERQCAAILHEELTLDEFTEILHDVYGS